MLLQGTSETGNLHLEAGNLWYAMQYLPYATLGDVVRALGPPDEDALLFLARRLLQTLAPLQERGVAHRDIKPSNLALGGLGPGPELALLDLGISRFEMASKLTMAGAMHPGTPEFMSPEQVQGTEISSASDLFSTASTLVWLASSGRTPAFTGETTAEVMHRITTEEPDLSAVPNSMKDTLAAFLEKDPDKVRVPTPASPPHGRQLPPVRRARRRGNRVVRAGGLAGGGVVFGAAALAGAPWWASVGLLLAGALPALLPQES
ncbi:protein kinase [Streptomyces sp. NPDC005480]|uniref:protein kinase domain-containing protein n=1 Tax=Streptomyces sp. NPDC005480 TaxID=3154880 RepID=UPI0033BA259C